MKRVLAVLAMLGLLVGSPLPVGAQPPQPWFVYNGNQLFSFVASQQVINTTASALIFSGIVPPGLFATPPSINIIGANAPSPAVIVQGTTANVQTMGNVIPMPIPVHISIKGSITYASGTINMGANWGKGTGFATVSLVSAGSLTTAWTPVAAQGNQTTNTGGAAGNANPWAPINIDCWAIPVATGSGTLNSLPAGVLTCRTEIANLTATPGSTNTFLVAGSTSTGFSVASAQVLNVRFQWGSAAAGNALVIHSATATLGW